VRTATAGLVTVPSSSLSVMVGLRRWLSRRRNEGVENCSFETELGVPVVGLRMRRAVGVANVSRRKRLPVLVGVLLCFLLTGSERHGSSLFARDLLGVFCPFGSTAPSVVRKGEGPVNESKRPRTFPSFCGVGPMEVRRWEGVKSLRMDEGES